MPDMSQSLYDEIKELIFLPSVQLFFSLGRLLSKKPNTVIFKSGWDNQILTASGIG